MTCKDVLFSQLIVLLVIRGKLLESELCFFINLCTFAPTNMFNLKRTLLWHMLLMMNVLHAEHASMNVR
jgi:hypothetical protein